MKCEERGSGLRLFQFRSFWLNFGCHQRLGEENDDRSAIHLNNSSSKVKDVIDFCAEQDLLDAFKTEEKELDTLVKNLDRIEKSFAEEEEFVASFLAQSTKQSNELKKESGYDCHTATTELMCSSSVSSDIFLATSWASLTSQSVLDNHVSSDDKSGWNSLILTSRSEDNQITSWLGEEMKRKDQPNLLYRASCDGWEVNSFRSKCSNKNNTIILVKTSEGYIFGGYNDQSWNSKYEKGQCKRSRYSLLSI